MTSSQLKVKTDHLVKSLGESEKNPVSDSRDSNLWSPAYQSDAPTTELQGLNALSHDRLLIITWELYSNFHSNKVVAIVP